MAPPAKRRRLDQPEEITFDPSARQEYLSGFHKRKQQRIQNARETAAKREKEEKVRERKQLREQRKEDLERHVTEVNAELKKMQRDVGESSGDDGSDGEAEAGGEGWEGIEEEDSSKANQMPDDEEYVDEDKYTTVTVEAMDGEDDAPVDSEDEQNPKVVTAAKGDQKDEAGGVVKKKRIHSKDGQTKPKKKKFRYESKAERQTTRQKQKAKNHKAKLRRTGN